MTGQVSRERIAELCVQLLTLPQGCNKTFEVREEMETASSLNLKEQWEQRDFLRAGFNSQLHRSILNKTSYFRVSWRAIAS